jgi:hypothetical protein
MVSGGGLAEQYPQALPGFVGQEPREGVGELSARLDLSFE